MIKLFKREKATKGTDPVSVIVERTADQMLMEYLISASDTDVEIMKKDCREFSDLEVYQVHGECYKSQEIDDGKTFEYNVFHYHDGAIDLIYSEKGIYNKLSLAKRNTAKRLFTEFVKNLRLSTV